MPKAIWPTLAFCLLAALLTGAACAGHDQGVKWGYDGPGAPERWASLSEEYATCADGQRQSPINIAGYDRGDGAPIALSYSGDAAAVRNDGRFVHVDYGRGNTLSVGRRTYELKSAHFHSPSEHLIDGRELCGGVAPGPRGRRRQPGGGGAAVQAGAHPVPWRRRFSMPPQLPAIPSSKVLHSAPETTCRVSWAIIGTMAQRRRLRATNQLTGM